MVFLDFTILQALRYPTMWLVRRSYQEGGLAQYSLPEQWTIIPTLL